MIFTGLCFTTEITLLSEREREKTNALVTTIV